MRDTKRHDSPHLFQKNCGASKALQSDSPVLFTPSKSNGLTEKGRYGDLSEKAFVII